MAGLDVAYQGDRLAAAVVVIDPNDLSVLDTAVVRGESAFPYIPGLFAFREIPSLLDALDKLRVREAATPSRNGDAASLPPFRRRCSVSLTLKSPG